MDMKELLIAELRERIETIEYNMSQGGSWIESQRDYLEGKMAGYRSVIGMLK